MHYIVTPFNKITTLIHSAIFFNLPQKIKYLYISNNCKDNAGGNKRDKLLPRPPQNQFSFNIVLCFNYNDVKSNSWQEHFEYFILLVIGNLVISGIFALTEQVNHMRIDHYDMTILDILQRDGRISKRKLAECIDLSPTLCWTRLRRLEDKGFINGYHANINYQRLGKLILITSFVKLEGEYQGYSEKFESAILRTPEIITCEAISGIADYILTILVSSIEHYQHIYDSLIVTDIGISKFISYFQTKIVKKSLSLPINNPNELDLLPEEEENQPCKTK